MSNAFAKASQILADAKAHVLAAQLDQALAQPAPPRPGQAPNLTSKLMVLRFHARDYALLKELLAASQAQVPELTMDAMCSSIITDLCRRAHERQGQPA